MSKNQTQDFSTSFWEELSKKAPSKSYRIAEGVVSPSAIVDLPDNDTTEIFVFANFDICNFTKYKRENHDWIDLLQKFLLTTSSPSSDWSLTKFWKFNGDSLTFRKKVNSVVEICCFIEQAQRHLEKLQEYLNENNTSHKNIYVKSAVWIAGFSNNKHKVVNNTKFRKSPFGEEFVGENIDEGFRLSTCSKAGKLVVDPKIVSIFSLFISSYELAKETQSKLKKNFSADEYCKAIVSQLGKDFHKCKSVDKKIKDMQALICESLKDLPTDDFINSLNKIYNSFYLMEFEKCKGVWDDRDYPIFWYIEDVSKCDFVYDEIVAGVSLRQHKIFSIVYDSKNRDEVKKEFEYNRDNVLTICGQIEVLSSIKELVQFLSAIPQGVSEETIFDTANLYYMVACVVKKDGQDLGVLIFKRTDKRKHLKGVWDLVPIKHGRVFRPGISFSICNYLQYMLNHKLNLKKYADKFVLEQDIYRDSIKPYALCNIYRNGENHNGVLCVAEVDIECTIEEFLEDIKKNLLDETQYCDVKLVTSDNIDEKSQDQFDISFNNMKIRSLSPEEVKEDSNEVANDPLYYSFKEDGFGTNGVGISFLGYSIDQILKERQIKLKINNT